MVAGFFVSLRAAESDECKKPAVAKVGAAGFTVGVLTPTPGGRRARRVGDHAGRNDDAGSGAAGHFGDGGVAASFVKLRALGEHAVELVNQQGHGLVTLFGGDGGVHVGPVDDDVTLGGETVFAVLFGVAFELHTHADDALFVSEKSVDLVVDELF